MILERKNILKIYKKDSGLLTQWLEYTPDKGKVPGSNLG